MTPDWVLNVIWFAAACATGAFFFLAQRNSRGTLWAACATVAAASLAIALHIRNDRIRQENQRAVERVASSERPATPGVGVASQEVKFSVAIGEPKAGQAIPPVYDEMRGTYQGAFPGGFELWVLAQDQYNHFVMYPPTDVSHSGRWSQKDIGLATPGRWELEVCLANKEGSQWLRSRATKRNFSGFPELPDGIEIQESVFVT